MNEGSKRISAQPELKNEIEPCASEIAGQEDGLDWYSQYVRRPYYFIVMSFSLLLTLLAILWVVIKAYEILNEQAAWQDILRPVGFLMISSTAMIMSCYTTVRLQKAREKALSEETALRTAHVQDNQH